jgi:alanyl-tRNA synthetase
MPDFSAFGPSIECLSKGLELVNHVFMEFEKGNGGFRELDIKVNDTGWGHERLVWFSNGGETSYDIVFAPVVRWMKKQAGIKETGLFSRYAALAGGLDFEERDVGRVKRDIAKKLGVEVSEIERELAPLQGLYAIADHAKSLLFAVTDGAIPSNVGGGYNLRVILRRALSFIREFSFGFDLVKIAELHARHLKKMFPELKEGLELFPGIMDAEKERYDKSLARASAVVEREVEKGIDEKALIRLYTSHGISPEAVKKAAERRGKKIRIPEDFYLRVTEYHMKGRKEKETYEGRLGVDVSSVRPTEKLYYRDPYLREMDATVLASFRIGGSWWVALDRTVFYPEGGGQPPDWGVLVFGGKDIPVKDVQKIGSVVLHKTGSGLPAGGKVRGKIDWNRRAILMKMHDATHILAGAARKVLGKGAWQAGAQKGVRHSRLDITHFRPFSGGELERIERLANSVVKKNLKITAKFMPRKEAEGRYGFVLYQGGASPGREVRVVEIKGHDVEACGGTHGGRTGEVGLIKIIKSERIQDGVNRIEFTAGEAALEFVDEMDALYRKVADAFRKNGIPLHGEESDKVKSLHEAASVFSVDVRQLPATVEKFLNETGSRGKIKGKGLAGLSASLFSVWKRDRKAREKLEREEAGRKARELLKKSAKGMIFEVIPGSRKELIRVAGEITRLEPGISVVLANPAGDIVGMSREMDMGKKIKEICSRAGGSGGGRGELGQGKVQLSKLLKIMHTL